MGLPADIAQWVEHRTREHNVSGHYRSCARIPGWPTKITNSLSEEKLSRAPV